MERDVLDSRMSVEAFTLSSVGFANFYVIKLCSKLYCCKISETADSTQLQDRSMSCRMSKIGVCSHYPFVWKQLDHSLNQWLSTCGRVIASSVSKGASNSSEPHLRAGSQKGKLSTWRSPPLGVSGEPWSLERGKAVLLYYWIVTFLGWSETG